MGNELNIVYLSVHTDQKAKFLQSLNHNLKSIDHGDHDFVLKIDINHNNILDIYPAAELLLPYYREKDFLIMGIAFGYDEATEVAARIVADLYRKTGGFCLNELLGDEAP